MSDPAHIPAPIRIVLVDDHRLFRDGLKRLLSGDRRFEVVGEAASGEEFLALPAKVDVVFMDIDMPGGMNGIEATRRALERWPEMRIIALSMHGDEEYRASMMEAGAKGFLLKNSEFGEVVVAVTGNGLPNDGLPPNSRPSQDEPLSERETEVLPLVCEGLSNHEIAEKLFISKRTVDKHRANILAKTGCKNTASLVVYAVKNNLITI